MHIVYYYKGDLNTKYLYFLFGVVIIFSIGVVYTSKVGKNERKEIENNMFTLTQDFVQAIDVQKFRNIQQNPSDKESLDYKSIREKLLELGRLNKNFGIRWIYTMIPRDGQIVFSVDSIPLDSPDYSDPGDTYIDASPDFIESFNLALTKGVSSMTKPYKDQWGYFFSITVPIIDKNNGEIVGVLATDMDYQLFFLDKINNAKRLPIIITISSEIIFSGLFFYILFLLKSKKKILRLADNLNEDKKNLEKDDLLMKSVISSIGEGLIILDNKYAVKLINPKALEFLMYNGMNILGKDIHDIVKITKKKKEISLDDFITKDFFVTKKTITTTIDDDICISTDRQKNPLAVTFTVSPLVLKDDSNKNNFIIVIHNANKEIELDKVKSGFISIASHQLRAPLTSIRWYSEMLLAGSKGKLNEDQTDIIKEISEGVVRLYKTINTLLDISRLEGDVVGKDKKPIDLTEITAQVIKELSPSIVEKKLVYFSFSAQTDTIVVNLDETLLRQVILNLFVNAILYTNEKGTIEGRWMIDKENNVVIYSVRDNGIGIPKSEQDKVFTKFFRAGNAKSKVPDGTGLGLSLIKDIVTSWEGKIWFETEEGKGTTFFFTIPIA